MRIRNPREVGNSLLYGADEAWDARCRDSEAEVSRTPASEEPLMQDEDKQLTVICQLQTARSPLLIDEAAAWRFIEYEAADLPDPAAVRAVAHYWHVQHQRNSVLRRIARRLKRQRKQFAAFSAGEQVATRETR